jgi:hypothetical protein
MTGTPLIGRNAVIEMGGVAIGYATGFSADITVDKIEEFQLGSPNQAILAAGNQHFKISCDRLWIDATYVTQILAGTAVAFILAPAGTVTGNPKITISNVILLTQNMTVTQKGVVGEKITGEGNSYVTGTF